MKNFYTGISVVFILVFWIIGCSPTRFSSKNSIESVCDSSATSCLIGNGSITKTYDDPFFVGQGKVDILIVNDNSASMLVVQNKFAKAFSDFISNLDSKKIDYRIAMSNTDANSFLIKPLLEIGNSNSKYILNSDSNRLSLFNSAIIRNETQICEDFIRSSYYTYGPTFQTNSFYINNYAQKCPSSDERGIYSVINVVNKVDNFLREDANFNIILISNEDVRSGNYVNNSNFALTDDDKYENLTNLINTKLPGKYWEFNSIITKDVNCANLQKNSFKDNNGNTILNGNGSYVVDANPGVQYGKLSSSASVDIDGNPSLRGQTLSICENDYSFYFSNIAAKISDAARLLTMKCVPVEPPSVIVTSNSNANVPYEWVPSSNKILFKRGSEGLPIRVQYKCKTNLVQ